MIKVNLLKDQATQVRRTVVKPPEYSHTGLAFVAAFVVLLAGLGTWWYFTNNQVNDLREKRDKLQVDFQRLQALKEEIDEYEKKKLVQQSRIEIIETLKTNQTGPVLLLNHVIESIPTDASVWLNVLDQKGDRIHIKGFALNSESLPDFMSNLALTGFFRSVDLELIEDQEEAARFSLVCTTMQGNPLE